MVRKITVSPVQNNSRGGGFFQRRRPVSPGEPAYLFSRKDSDSRSKVQHFRSPLTLKSFLKKNAYNFYVHSDMFKYSYLDAILIHSKWVAFYLEALFIESARAAVRWQARETHTPTFPSGICQTEYEARNLESWIVLEVDQHVLTTVRCQYGHYAIS